MTDKGLKYIGKAIYAVVLLVFVGWLFQETNHSGWCFALLILLVPSFS